MCETRLRPSRIQGGWISDQVWAKPSERRWRWGANHMRLEDHP